MVTSWVLALGLLHAAASLSSEDGVDPGEWSVVLLQEDFSPPAPAPANASAPAPAPAPEPAPGVPQGSTCGDSMRTGEEQCDDGNSNPGDGCSATCTVEVGYECNGGGEDAKDECDAICGDGKQVGTEQCDDGNIIDGDGCSGVCGFEAGFSCEAGNVDHKSQCTPDCGDKKIVGYEECDDGNKQDGDGCSSTCNVEVGFSCKGLADDLTATARRLLQDDNTTALDNTTAPAPAPAPAPAEEAETSGPGPCHPICGDGRRVGNEECDDGNRDDGDGCGVSCQIEPSKFCYGGSPSSADQCYDLVCGDSKTGGPEGCDDGNLKAGDGCDAECNLEDGWSCDSSATMRSKCHAICGDGQKLGLEECDDGNTVDGDGCDGNCKLEAGWQCPAGLECSQIVCGDGMVAPSEACDDGNSVNNDGCSNAQADPPCGIELGWTCDGGNENAPSRCSSMCGDGKRVGFEGCDDGNKVSGDGCTDDCRVEPGYACIEGSEVSTRAVYKAPNAQLGTVILLDLRNETLSANNTVTVDAEPVPADRIGKVSTCAEQICGDGKRQGTEECDDFNTVSGDGCSETCSVEEGYECNGGSWTDKDECTPRCGDGIQMVGEACDDGNRDVGDGCSDKCLVEPGYECSDGECSTVCGDGRRAGAEQCDDGNADNGDGCSAACQIEQNYSCSPVEEGSADTCVLKVNCETSEWGMYTACSKPCGAGIQKRSRVIVTSPANGGVLCPVLDEERRCNTQGCTPVDCVVSGWGAFGECSKKCGGGTQARTRSVVTEPEHDGGPCPAVTEERTCNTGSCASIACEVNQWSEWSACDKACGGGSAKRTRTIKTEAENGGAECPMLSETRACNTAGCPQRVDCKVSEWSEFSECDKACGGGLQIRNRQIEIEAAHGGAACPSTVESRNCNTEGCAVDAPAKR